MRKSNSVKFLVFNNRQWCESHPPGDNKASVVDVHKLTPGVPFVLG